MKPEPIEIEITKEEEWEQVEWKPHKSGRVGSMRCNRENLRCLTRGIIGILNKHGCSYRKGGSIAWHQQQLR
jgi:hypothetical protein